MQSISDSAGHRTYLLSLWRETPGAPWRAALRLAGSGERIGFADLEALALFLLRLDTACVILSPETTLSANASGDWSAAE